MRILELLFLASSHFTLVGVERPHAMESVIPDEIWAQALSEAVRNAVSLSAPEADRQAGLGRYLMYRQQTRCGGDHLFGGVFRHLLESAGLQPSNGRWPRIHDLSHTFAVRALESSPTGRQRIGQHAEMKLLII